MPNFLTLCNDTARESGTFKNIPAFETLTGITGRGLRVMNWVADAYRDIQLSHNAWRFLRGEWEGETISGTQEYDSSALGISERFGGWTIHDEEGMGYTTIYRTSDGSTYEMPIPFVRWPTFRRQAMVGTARSQTGHPNCFSVNDAGNIVLYPTPDDSYTLRGMYQKSPQVLSEDSHTPEMPERFHGAIVFRALLKLAIFDESPEQMPLWENEMNAIMAQLTADQLPRVRMQPPLA